MTTLNKIHAQILALCVDAKNTAFVQEWKWWFSVALFSFFFASVLMSGWPEGLIPNIRSPFHYEGDGFGYGILIQTGLDGLWFFKSDRLGYPFGLNLLDFPNSDAFSFVILKLISLFWSDYFQAFNIYFLLSFPVVVVVSYTALRHMNLQQLYSVAGALLFAFVPFHFGRIPHLFYTWYFCVPIFFVIGHKLFRSSGAKTSFKSDSFGWAFLGLVAILGSVGVYYSLFGLIVLTISALAGAIANSSITPIRKAVFYCVAIVAVIALNGTPSIIYKQVEGSNPTALYRTSADSEQYGLKLSQLLLPRSDHRSQFLAEPTRRYNSTFPLVNENATATLGFVGVFGLLVICYTLIASLTRKTPDDRLAFLAIVVVVLFGVATIGGISSLIGLLISPMIRSWNRASIFIGFGAITAAMIALQLLQEKYAKEWRRGLPALGLTALVLFGLWDTTVQSNELARQRSNAAFKLDQEFVAKIEHAYPDGAAVYQLPYMQYPEVGAKNQLQNYELSAGFLNSKNLRWSYGVFKGRQGDVFYGSLASQSIATQLKVIAKLGFSAVYVDRRGYADGGVEIERELRASLDASPAFERADKQIVVYKIEAKGPLIQSSVSLDQVVAKSGFSPTRETYFGAGSGTLSSLTGSISGAKIAVSGKAGYAVYGPYAKLEAGKYRLIAEGSITPLKSTNAVDVGKLGDFDVSINAGTRVIKAVPIFMTPNAGAEIVNIDFDLVDGVSDAEFRILLNEKAEMVFRGYHLIRRE